MGLGGARGTKSSGRGAGVGVGEPSDVSQPSGVIGKLVLPAFPNDPTIFFSLYIAGDGLTAPSIAPFTPPKMVAYPKHSTWYYSQRTCLLTPAPGKHIPAGPITPNNPDIMSIPMTK